MAKPNPDIAAQAAIIRARAAAAASEKARQQADAIRAQAAQNARGR